VSGLAQRIQIRPAYTRSINLLRDHENLELVRAYLPTSRAIQALTQIADGLSQDARQRALALIGPYGSGKSAFALFLSALLAEKQSAVHQAALTTLQATQPQLAERFQQALTSPRGFLRVPMNGIPDSLTRQLMLALAAAAEQNKLSKGLIRDLHAAAHPGTPMDQVLALIRRVQTTWSAVEGTGVLIEIDELGKFLEYESYHPQHREIHLLQLLAEHAQQAHYAPLHLVVLLHQGFEYYSHHLGKRLGDEWQKVQGRFDAIAFLEPAEQSLRIVSAAFASVNPLPPTVAASLQDWMIRLVAEGALPPGLDEHRAREQFSRCYPLHPLTLLILPVLCQKVAQNERTLFSYLGSHEPFGFLERLAQMQIDQWIEPWELYDYFILNQAGGFSDPLTYHRWVEVITALERFDYPPDSAAVRLLKTIGLLNLIGAQRGLKASPPILQLLFGQATDGLLEALETASIIHFRHYSQEYRVWQGSDFDLRSALQQAMAEQASLSLVDILNTLLPLKPLVARRATIKTGALRCFMPGFTSRERWPPKASKIDELPLWFYLAEEPESLPDWPSIPQRAVVALCQSTERLREAVAEWMALQELPKRYAALQSDPVAQREYQTWLTHAESETTQLISALLEEPESLRWFFGGEEQGVRDRRDLQRQLSAWVEEVCYPQAPLIKNELVNWDHPSASANTGRKRLLAAMLNAADQESLGIEKTPAEKSLYLSLLKASGLHRQGEVHWGFYPPVDEDPCRLSPIWQALTQMLGDHGERQVELTAIYEVLRRPPYGVKLGVLPVLIIAYLLAHRREVALYQEGGFCEELAMQQVELLCRRPELFALERFDLAGLRGELFDRYLHSVVGKVRQDATLLDIVRPLMKFVGGLPEYTLYCKGLSREAEQVRAAFQQAKSPGVLLFEALPEAFGLQPVDFTAGDLVVVERFIQRLVQALRELKRAYEVMLGDWQAAVNRALLDEVVLDLAGLRQALAERYGDLERYTPDRMGLGALIRRLADSGFASDQAWLESIATLLGRMPPQKWREETRLQAELRLSEVSEQLRDLEKLRTASGIQNIEGAVLVKMVDAQRGEVSRVIQLSSEQWASVGIQAEAIAGGLAGLDESVQLAVVAALLGRFSEPRRLNEQLSDD
jgi:hypothetical protein